MVKPTKYILTLFFLLGFSPALAQNGNIKSLSLEEALEIAETQNYQIRIARGELSQAKGKNLEAFSGFLPHLSFSENYIRSNDPVTVFSLKLKQGIFTQQDFSLDALNQPDDLENFTTAMQVQQPILNLDAIFGKSAASLGVKARNAALNRTHEAVDLQVTKAYYGLVLAGSNAEAVAAAVRSAEQHRDDAKEAFGQGVIHEADYLAAEVRLAELREQQIQAVHQTENARDGLQFLLGITDNKFIVPTDSLDAAVIDASPDENWEESIQSRFDLQSLRYRSQASRRNSWMARSAWLPNLNAFGTVEWNASEAFHKDASNWAVGVQLRWQLFEGLGIFGRAKQTGAAAEIAEVQKRQAVEQAKMDVRRAQRFIQSANERMQAAESAVRQAQESLRIIEARFAQGLEKTSELLDKEVALTNAKLRLLRAKHDLIIAKNELQFALGKNLMEHEE